MQLLNKLSAKFKPKLEQTGINDLHRINVRNFNMMSSTIDLEASCSFNKCSNKSFIYKENTNCE